MIGEAVPPRFTNAQGRVLVELLGDGRPEGLLLRSDRRVSAAAQKLGSLGTDQGPRGRARAMGE